MADALWLIAKELREKVPFGRTPEGRPYAGRSGRCSKHGHVHTVVTDDDRIRCEWCQAADDRAALPQEEPHPEGSR